MATQSQKLTFLVILVGLACIVYVGDTTNWFGMGGEVLPTGTVIDEWDSGGEAMVAGVCNAGFVDYSGLEITHTIKTINFHTGANADVTSYIYTSEPENWGLGSAPIASGYIQAIASSSGSASIKLKPGTYWVRSKLTSYYDKFTILTVGKCWNENFEPSPDDTWRFIDSDTLSLPTTDTGTIANSSSEQRYTSTTTETVTSDTGYELKEIRLLEDVTGTYTPFSDADGNAVYNEGLTELTLTLSCGGETIEWTPWNSDTTVDEFGGDSTAILQLSDYTSKYPDGVCFVDEFESITITLEYRCSTSLDSAIADDEKCGSGEDYVSLILIDSAGTSASVVPTL